MAKKNPYKNVRTLSEVKLGVENEFWKDVEDRIKNRAKEATRKLEEQLNKKQKQKRPKAKVKRKKGESPTFEQLADEIDEVEPYIPQAQEEIEETIKRKETEDTLKAEKLREISEKNLEEHQNIVDELDSKIRDIVESVKTDSTEVLKEQQQRITNLRIFISQNDELLNATIKKKLQEDIKDLSESIAKRVAEKKSILKKAGTVLKGTATTSMSMLPKLIHFATAGDPLARAIVSGVGGTLGSLKNLYTQHKEKKAEEISRQRQILEEKNELAKKFGSAKETFEELKTTREQHKEAVKNKKAEIFEQAAKQKTEQPETEEQEPYPTKPPRKVKVERPEPKERLVKIKSHPSEGEDLSEYMRHQIFIIEGLIGPIKSIDENVKLLVKFQTKSSENLADISEQKKEQASIDEFARTEAERETKTLKPEEKEKSGLSKGNLATEMLKNTGKVDDKSILDITSKLGMSSLLLGPLKFLMGPIGITGVIAGLLGYVGYKMLYSSDFSRGWSIFLEYIGKKLPVVGGLLTAWDEKFARSEHDIILKYQQKTGTLSKLKQEYHKAKEYERQNPGKSGFNAGPKAIFTDQLADSESEYLKKIETTEKELNQVKHNYERFKQGEIVRADDMKLEPQKTKKTLGKISLSNSYKPRKDIARPNEEYMKYIKEASQETGLPEEVLIGLISTENAQLNPNAHNKEGGGKGARGIMQLRGPASEDVNLSDEDVFDPEKNIKAGAKYLKMQIEKTGSIEEGIAAYNQGYGNRKNEEGKAYAQLVLSRAEGYKQAKQLEIQNRPHAVNVKNEIQTAGNRVDQNDYKMAGLHGAVPVTIPQVVPSSGSTSGVSIPSNRGQIGTRDSTLSAQQLMILSSSG